VIALCLLSPGGCTDLIVISINTPASYLQNFFCVQFFFLFITTKLYTYKLTSSASFLPTDLLYTQNKIDLRITSQAYTTYRFTPGLLLFSTNTNLSRQHFTAIQHGYLYLSHCKNSFRTLPSATLLNLQSILSESIKMPDTTATVEVCVIINGNRRTVNPAFPVYLLRRFSAKGKAEQPWDGKNNSKLFKFHGLDDAAIKLVLAWMRANAKNSSPEQLCPNELNLRQAAQLYQVASKAFNITPRPEQLRDLLVHKIKNTILPVASIQCLQTILVEDQALVKLLNMTTAEHFVRGQLDDAQVKAIQAFTATQRGLDQDITEAVRRHVSFCEREAKRDRAPSKVLRPVWKDKNGGFTLLNEVEEVVEEEEEAEEEEPKFESKQKAPVDVVSHTTEETSAEEKSCKESSGAEEDSGENASGEDVSDKDDSSKEPRAAPPVDEFLKFMERCTLDQLEANLAREDFHTKYYKPLQGMYDQKVDEDLKSWSSEHTEAEVKMFKAKQAVLRAFVKSAEGALYGTSLDFNDWTAVLEMMVVGMT
jgi:hypothetical protein